MDKTVAIDTNVIVRFLTGDDPAQAARAKKCISGNDVFITDTVLLETEWVLRYAYHFDSAAVIKAMKFLLGLPNVHLESPSRVVLALDWHAEGLDFADALHLAGSQDHASFLSFDQKFIKRSEGLGRAEVSEPTA